MWIQPRDDEDAAVTSETPPSETAPVRRGRRYIKYVVGALAAFGILGAVGSYAVDKFISAAEEKLRPEKALLIGVREVPQDEFFLATRSAVGLDAKLAGVEGCDRLMVAAKRVGATDVGAVRKAVVLEGGTRRDVSITGMRAKILKREPALAGALMSCHTAGGVPAIAVLFNLEEESPVARKMTEPYSLKFGGPYFEGGNIVRLVKGEIQPLLLIGVSRDDYVEWEVEADVEIDGNEQTVTINDDGKPFRVSGAPPSKTGYERYYEWQWYTQPERMWISDRPPSGP